MSSRPFSRPAELSFPRRPSREAFNPRKGEVSLMCSAARPTPRPCNSGNTPATPPCATGTGSWCGCDEPWELYDLAQDPTELTNLAGERPDLVTKYANLWQEWADRVGVLPWAVTVEVYRERGESLEIAGG